VLALSGPFARKAIEQMLLIAAKGFVGKSAGAHLVRRSQRSTRIEPVTLLQKLRADMGRRIRERLTRRSTSGLPPPWIRRSPAFFAVFGVFYCARSMVIPRELELWRMMQCWCQPSADSRPHELRQLA